MRKVIILIALLLSTLSIKSQTFADFLAQINASPINLRPILVDSFMNAVPGFPFIEQDTLAHYLYRGNANTVSVPGDANGWNPSSFPMTKIEGTNFWYRTEIFENDARLDYKFVLNGSNWILDPRNPYTVTGGFGPNSELRMPAYIIPPEIGFYPNIPHGALQDTMFFSSNLGNQRLIRVYLPPAYQSSADSFPTILFHDGLEYISLAKSNNVLDYLIDQNLIEPVIAVFVPPINRTAEYAGNLQNQFTAFIVNEIIPWVDAKYRTIQSPQNRAVMGASNGGNISLWLGLTHPEIFGHIAAQSSNVQNSISSGFQNGSILDLQFYLDLGTYDIPQLIPLVLNLVQILQSKGYTYQFMQYHEGHSWGFWRAHIDDALQMFFPAPPNAIEPDDRKPKGFLLHPNYPNPFNPQTNIPFFLNRAVFASIKIYNILGQELDDLAGKLLAAGKHNVSWDGKDRLGKQQASGIYLYQLQIEGLEVAARKMVLLR